MGRFIRTIRKKCRKALRSSPIEIFTRFGYVSKGTVYLLIGLLALLAALDAGGAPGDPRGFLQRLPEQPLGAAVLFVIAAGMFCYAIWRFVFALSDSPVFGRNARTFSVRAGKFGSAVAYTGIGLYALRLLVSMSDPAAGISRTSTAHLLDLPGGQLLTGAAGLLIVAGGALQIRRGIQERFRHDLRTLTMSPAGKRWTRRAGKLGHAARGVVFGLIGVFLIFSAWDTAPGEGRGLEESLDVVAAMRVGPWLLGIVAAGLTCYGAYCLIEARYRRISH